MLKSYYQEHKEEIKQKSKDWAKNNPCKVLAAGRKYKDLNKEKVIEEHRLYRKLHPENKVLSELKRRQLKRSLGEKYFITKDDWYRNGCALRLGIDQLNKVLKAN